MNPSPPDRPTDRHPNLVLAAAALDVAHGLADVDDLADLPVEAQAAWARQARPVLVDLLAALVDRQAPADPTPPLDQQANAIVMAASAWHGAVKASKRLEWSEAAAAIEAEASQQLLDAVDAYLNGGAR